MDYNHSHRIHRVGWLRAAVMGANDGIVSIASLVIGVAAASAATDDIVLAGLAGLVAGAMSMAAGEYVSVSSQADTERADIALERKHLHENPEEERLELIDIYRERGLDKALAEQVANQLMAKDPLEAHLRDELGITDVAAAKPIQAALASAATFTLGGVLPLIPLALVPHGYIIESVAVLTLLALVFLGVSAAYIGGAKLWKGALRVTFWGAMAMCATALIGVVFDVVVS